MTDTSNYTSNYDGTRRSGSWLDQLSQTIGTAIQPGVEARLGGGTPQNQDAPTIYMHDYLQLIAQDSTATITTPSANWPVGPPAPGKIISIPTKAMLIAAWINIDSALTGAAGCTGVGLGYAAHEADFGECTALTQNSKSTKPLNMISPFTGFFGPTTPVLYATDGAGTPTGTFDAGVVRVRILWAVPTDLPNA